MLSITKSLQVDDSIERIVGEISYNAISILKSDSNQGMHLNKPTGLYFTPTAVQTATQRARRAPFKDAFALLDELRPTDPTTAAVAAGFRYQFQQDERAAAQVGKWLAGGGGLNVQTADTYGACAALMAAGHAYTLVQDTVPAATASAWVNAYDARVTPLCAADSSTLAPLEVIWQMALQVVAGVVLQRGDLFSAGVDVFKQVIAHEIHPEGYMPRLVENSAGGGLQRQVLAAQGLALAAEAATHAGEPLWAYDVRGISAKTTAIYAAAYFEYRDTWQWDEPPTEAETDAFYREHGAFLEMLNVHLRPVVLKATLDKLRPLFSPYGGGLTTLSHGVPQRRGLFG